MIELLWTICISIALVILLSIVTLSDIRHLRISNVSCLILGTIGVCHSIIIRQSWVECMLGFVSISFPLLALCLLTHVKIMGGGDIKLLAASGVLLGWQKNLLAFLISGVCLMIQRLCSKTSRCLGDKAALGPYISIGIMMSFLFGDLVISIYQNWSGRFLCI